MRRFGAVPVFRGRPVRRGGRGRSKVEFARTALGGEIVRGQGRRALLRRSARDRARGAVRVPDGASQQPVTRRTAMRKLKLEALAVESFDTTPAGAARVGTVLAQQCTCPTACTCPGAPPATRRGATRRATRAPTPAPTTPARAPPATPPSTPAGTVATPSAERAPRSSGASERTKPASRGAMPACVRP
jgi:hypothetical protein